MEKENSPKDTLYQQPMDTVRDFAFTEEVAGVFDDMLNRSIPGYATQVALLAVMAARYARPETRLYDLGCSHGILTGLLKTQVNHDGCEVVAVDNSPPLLQRCRDHIEKLRPGLPVRFVCEDVCRVSLENASVVVMHYILQFIDPRDKDALILKAYEALQPGGVLLLSEKVDFSDPDENTFQREYHHIFKGLQGYSDLEIAQKQAALKNVLKLDTIAQHKRRLNKAGFGPVYVWYQCCNFISLAAVRS